MRRVRLGQTDLRVSALACGTWSFGGEWAQPIATTPGRRFTGHWS
jgi:aryl-alcohol dehydrogenase-like predicted oxidoreductase